MTPGTIRRKDVFERRMLNGSALLSFLGSGFIYIFRANRLYESKDISMNTMSLSVDVRRSKTPLLKLPNDRSRLNNLTAIMRHKLYFKKGAFFWDYSVHSYSGLRLTE